MKELCRNVNKLLEGFNDVALNSPNIERFVVLQSADKAFNADLVDKNNADLCR